MIHAVYKVTSEPATEPVSLESLKTSLRITTCDFDEELQRLLIAARQQVENDARIKLVTQTVVLYADRFPAGRILELRTPPVQSVTSVQYVDEDESTQTLSTSLYATDLTTTPPRIVLNEDETWPTTDDVANAVTVTFVAGYGGVSAVPVQAKLAIAEYARMHWKQCDYGNRTAYDNLINYLQWTAVGCVQ